MGSVGNMTRALCSVLLLLLLAVSAGKAVAQASPEAADSGQVTDQEAETVYDPMSRSRALGVKGEQSDKDAEYVEAQPALSEAYADQRLYSEYRLRQLDFKLHTILALALTSLLAHFLVLHYFRVMTSEYNGRDLVTATGLIYVIFGTIILTQMALDTQQMMAATGILGAVAGYLFGVSRIGGSERANTAKLPPAAEGQATGVAD